MPWFAVDDALHSHPKWLAATPGARALWVTAGSWCAANLTDGRVPKSAIGRLGARQRDAKTLTAIGLWIDEGEAYRFHDWSDRNPTKEQVEAARAAARERRARAKARDVRATFAERAASPSLPLPSPSSNYSSSSKESGSERARNEEARSAEWLAEHRAIVPAPPPPDLRKPKRAEP